MSGHQGEFVYEDGTGNIILSSSPGISSSISPLPVSKKVIERKTFRRPTIDLFDKLAEIEIDESWKERFHNMSNGKFTRKITWNDTPDDPFKYGEMIYKSRQIKTKTPILVIERSYQAEEIRSLIIDFINNYTNIETGGDLQQQEDDFKIVDKSDISPIPWKKMTPKDQVLVIQEYIKDFGASKSLDKKSTDELLDKVVIYILGKDTINNLKIDVKGNITDITNIYKRSDGVYDVKR
jgi:hypothetical protein